MSNLQHRQTKIQEKRKQTPRRDFVLEICSWQPIILYRNQDILSRYPDTNRLLNIVSPDTWTKQRENTNNIFGFISDSFFDDLGLLINKVELPSLIHDYENENSQYNDVIYGCKNCYLCFSIGDNANQVLYSYTANTNLVNVINSCQIYTNCTNIYQSNYISESYNIFFCQNVHNSNNLRLCNDCIGCNDCILCSNIENQSYCINNISYSKEDFLLLKNKFLEENKSNFVNYYGELKTTYKNIATSGSLGSVGLYNCDNVINSMFVKNVTNSQNICLIDGYPHSSNLYDCVSIGLNCHDCAAFNLGGMDCYNVYCSDNIGTCSDIYYSMMLNNCSFCFGCIGLKNKSYCILNKQYTKEEWYEKVDEIFAQMEADGILGEFFPASMNPFYFNDTAAYLIDPSFTKEEVIAKGYLWRDEPIKVDIPEGVEIIKTNELDQYEGFDSEGNWTINKDILKKIIQDDSQNIYRIVPMEYDFLVKHGLPLPRKHRLDRMKENFRIN